VHAIDIIRSAAEIVLLGAPTSALAWFKPGFRFPFVVFGGLVVFWSSSGFDPPKLAYFIAASVALVAAVLRLRNIRDTIAFRSLTLFIGLSAIAFALVMLSALNALGMGVDPGSWFRDAAPYLLLCTVSIFVIDAAERPISRFAVPILVVSGSFTALSIALYYIAAREHQVLLPKPPVLPSGMLTIALFCYAVSRTVKDRVRWQLWALVSAALLAMLVVVVGRGYIVLAAVPLVVAALGEGGIRNHLRRLGQLLGATVAIGLVALMVLILISSVAYSSLPLYRLETIPRLILQPASDASFRERVEQMGVAWTAFVAHPVFGVGPGHVFRWTTSLGAVVASFNIDTSLSLLAKFGVIGVAIALGALAAMAALITGRLRVELSSTSRGALTGYIAAIVLILPIASPLEDKGLSFALICLLVMALTDRRSPFRGNQDHPGKTGQNASQVARDENVRANQEKTSAEKVAE
jgi:O-antigen ligase